MLPALGGRCVTPGDILFLCREGWASGKRLGFPSELTGLLYTKLLWLDTGMETGISKLGGGTAYRAEKKYWLKKKSLETEAFRYRQPLLSRAISNSKLLGVLETIKKNSQGVHIIN